MDSKPTRLLTISIPDKHLRIFLRSCVQTALASNGAQSDIRTRHGRIGLSSASGNDERLSMSTFCTPANVAGVTGTPGGIAYITESTACFIKIGFLPDNLPKVTYKNSATFYKNSCYLNFIHNNPVFFYINKYDFWHLLDYVIKLLY